MTDAPPLEATLAALPLPTVGIDRAERIVALNAAATDLLGEGVEGRHFITVLRQPGLVEAVERCLADGAPRQARFVAGEIETETTFNVHLHPVSGTQVLLLSFQDITQVAQAGQMRRDFVANVSHELRTPLTALMGFIETLGGPAKDDPAARERFLGIMAGETGRMNRLVGDLLSLSRVEAEERVRPTDRINLTQVLEQTLRSLNPLAVENGVHLVPDFGSDPLLLMGDADQLMQVFTNLIENAIKYGGSGEGVEITQQVQDRDPAVRGPAVRITVRDHGPGIDPVHLPRLTERFYRADTHRSRALGGTGLGLAIVKHILSRHRGRVRIASEPGQGAAFTVILPLDTDAA